MIIIFIVTDRKRTYHIWEQDDNSFIAILKLQSTSKTAAKVSGAFIICIGEFYSNISDVNGVSQLFVNMQQETVVQPFLSHSQSQIRLRAEKLLSDVHDVMGMVRYSQSNLCTSESKFLFACLAKASQIDLTLVTFFNFWQLHMNDIHKNS